MAQADIGLIGLAVMGENLILNMESKGFTVACFNRTVSKVDDFVNGRAKGKNIIGCHSIEELVASLKTPRKIMMMVKAGKAVDEFIEQLLPHLENGRHPHRRRQQQLPGHDPPDRATSRARASSTSAPASPAARKAPCWARPSCPAARPRPGRTSSRSSRRSPPRPRTARPAATGSARTARATSSRWSTTASSTATCR